MDFLDCPEFGHRELRAVGDINQSHIDNAGVYTSPLLREIPTIRCGWSQFLEYGRIRPRVIARH